MVTLYSVHAKQKGRASGRRALEIVERHRGEQWYTPELAEQREVVLAWDEMHAAIAARRNSEAATRARWLAASKRRRRAIRITLARRRQGRARALEWAHEAGHA
ncbi:MAG: hypothetical protein JO326_13545 [Acetobacteraceae bacterium]|nr:hypothetical protein [Acetobacteraceae bacterium]